MLSTGDLSCLSLVCAAVAALVGPGLVSGCGEPADEEVLVTYERPEATRTIISDEELAEFEARGVEIHEGLNPPSPDGTYVFDSGVWVYAPREENIGLEACDVRRTLTLEEDGQLTTQVTYLVGCSGMGESSGAYLSGADTCYTTYGAGTQVFEGCDHATVSVGSACVTDAGLTEVQLAWMVTDYLSGPCQDLIDVGRMPPEGGIVVIEETDGLAARVDEGG